MDTFEAFASRHNIKALRQLYDLVEAKASGLKALDIESNCYGSFLTNFPLSNISLLAMK